MSSSVEYHGGLPEGLRTEIGKIVRKDERILLCVYNFDRALIGRRSESALLLTDQRIIETREPGKNYPFFWEWPTELRQAAEHWAHDIALEKISDLKCNRGNVEVWWNGGPSNPITLGFYNKNVALNFWEKMRGAIANLNQRSTATTQSDDLTSQLQKLADLLQAGVITEAEFTTIKRRLIPVEVCQYCGGSDRTCTHCGGPMK